MRKIVSILVALVFVIGTTGLVFARGGDGHGASGHGMDMKSHHAKAAEEGRESRGAEVREGKKGKSEAVSAESQPGAVPPGLAKQGKTPPGLEKQNKTPKGWTKGKKTGWNK